MSVHDLDLRQFQVVSFPGAHIIYGLDNHGSLWVRERVFTGDSEEGKWTLSPWELLTMPAEPSLLVKEAVVLLQELLDADTGCGCCQWDDSWSVAKERAEAYIQRIVDNDST